MKKLLSIFFALAFIVCAAFPASAQNTDSSGTTLQSPGPAFPPAGCRGFANIYNFLPRGG